ncbi:hypothetical protein [Zongyangia hominis]|uniref:hypothetical protein n=1 Tax=Zongyangia hominis TaxID=2763677 RepID=UPI0021CCD5B6|nr:hypothetical protein [Zongyangia hominis]
MQFQKNNKNIHAVLTELKRVAKCDKKGGGVSHELCDMLHGYGMVLSFVRFISKNYQVIHENGVL